MDSPPDIPTLLDALQSDNGSERVEAAKILRRIGGASLVQPLTAILRHEAVEVRQMAAHLLGGIGEAPAPLDVQAVLVDAVPALIAATQDPSKRVRGAMVGALRKIKDPAAIPALTIALSDEDPYIRALAAGALGDMKAGSAAPALIVALDDHHWQVRYDAIQALGNIEDSAATPQLLQSAQSTDANIENAALFASLQIGSPEAIPVLVRSLLALEGEERQRAIQNLKDAPPNHRRFAFAQALVQAATSSE